MSNQLFRCAITSLVSIGAFVISTWATAGSINDPIGLWQTFDKDASKPVSSVRITDVAGVLVGRIERVNSGLTDARCTACTDERKNSPLVGLVILDGLRREEAGSDIWSGGQILDPESGKTYALRLRTIENGKELQIRASRGPFFATRRWTRLQNAN